MTLTTTDVREKPILFSGEMVRAIIAGRKVCTRRVISPQPTCDGDIEPHLVYPDEFVPWHQGQMQPSIISPWEVGSRLWVRETWSPIPAMKPGGYFTDPKLVNRECWYKADNDRPTWGGKWRPSIFMPRRLARILLEVTEVRVERLQAITEEEAIAEGFEPQPWGTWWQGYRDLNGQLIHQQWRGDEPPEWMIEPKKDAPRPDLDHSARYYFELLWSHLNARRKAGIYAWDKSPWVWVVRFKVLTTNGELP